PLKAEEDEEEDDITENNNEQQPHQQQQQQQRARKHRRPIRLCFFDAETSQDDPVQISQNINGYRHVPLLIIAEVICEACIRAGISIEDVGQRAQGCFCGNPRGQRWRNWCSPPFRNAPGDNTAFPNNITFNHRRMFFHSFDNAEDNPVDQFLDYLLNHGSQNMLTICIAHNGGKYDFHLLLEALHRRSHPPTRLCTTGLKIYSMSLGGYHQRKVLFKDSLNYFFCELDALPKVFALPEDLATSKPFFPYLYIQRQHLHQRIRGLPAIQYYQPEYKKAEKREKLIEWYVQQQTSVQITNFQLREQLIIYCVNDVAILRESVLRFRQLIGENTKNLDPFLTVSTAAGLALTTMRRCFLPENWIVHSPEGGYLRGRRASAESQRYIRFFELQHPEAAGHIQHAQWALGEAHVEDCGYRLDGLWQRSPPLRPLAIEYMGCYYHGCPKCFPVRDQRLAAGRTAEELFERTQQRLWELENQHGYQLHVVWGHEIKEKLSNNTQLRRKWFEIDCVRPMDPREDCLRGGRTEPFKLHHLCAEDEEILYIDIVSLYPYVMKARTFPIGHPDVLTRDTLLLPPNNPLPWTTPEHNIYKGLLLVRVQPPNFMNGNLPPVLPYRTHDGRLTFPLCAKCADNRQQRPCTHGERERSWLTGYTHVELNYALERGYKVVDIYEVWNYEKWDPNLFRSYVNTFIGLKQQASGWPDGCVSEMDRAAYLAEFERVEGIFLDPERIETNPGLRMIAKLLANSLWGKLAQRVCGTEVRYAKTPAEFHQLLEDPTIDMLDFDHVSEHLDRCVVRKKPEFAKAPNTNCLPVAAFVTSYARLHLYEYIEQVNQIGGVLLYCDTDSIIYVGKRNGQRVSEGEYLGQMKREVPSRRILEFIAGGPKNYGYRHVDASTGLDERAELKIRSFPLSYATHQLLNFNTMKQLVLNQFNVDGAVDDTIADDVFFVGNSIGVQFPQIGRTRRSQLYTHLARKEYRPCYEKGRIMPGMETLPFGHRMNNTQVI
uniref:DNA-directed DNA polymerase n=1 Tax=Meloidogyne incognita TaxID=6306 RepID=A0A914N8J3_MELIC